MTDAEIKRIAEGLSEAQRKLLIRVGIGEIAVNHRELHSARVLKRKGLGSFVDTSHKALGLIAYWNTPLGLAVRDYLEKSDG